MPALPRTVLTALAAAAALPAAALAACGAERTAAPALDRPQPVTGRPPVAFPAAGLCMALPEGWLRTDGRAPLVVTVSSSQATAAVWRYPRTEPLPADDAALQAAKGTLLAAAGARDPSFRATSSTVRRVGGQSAIEVRGRGAVDGRPRRLRSVHVFAQGAEVVVDGYAPDGQFATLDREVLEPLLDSLEVRRP